MKPTQTTGKAGFWPLKSTWQHLAHCTTTKHLRTCSPLLIPHNQESHHKWLQTIRSVVADRITSEKERVPSFTSLWHHWLRSCWISQLCQFSSLSDVYCLLPLPEQSGWLQNKDSSYSIDWEAPEVVQRVKYTVEYLTKRCKCKKGCVRSACGCVRKKKSYCGPGCECSGCVNLPLSQEIQQGSSDEDDNGSDVNATDSNGSSSEEELETEVITDMSEFPSCHCLMVPDLSCTTVIAHVY